jgi:hypothetical protein
MITKLHFFGKLAIWLDDSLKHRAIFIIHTQQRK